MPDRLAPLSEHICTDAIHTAPTRDGFGTGALEAGRADARVVVLCADLRESTRAEWFQKEFPDRYIEMGVAEQNMATVASGMAAAGKIPFITSYAAFSPGRNYEQIRTTIALNRMSVKICGMHAGVSVGPDGATHQMLEDIGMMRMLPNMIVLNPGDAEEARKAVVSSAKTDGPVYIRFGRAATPVFTASDTPFEIGKALLLWRDERPTVTLASTGALSYAALCAARALSTRGIECIGLHFSSIKPLDTKALVDAAKQTGRVVTIEEHQIAGGFGSAVAECLSEQHPVPVHRIGVHDEFGQSGSSEELLAHYGIDAAGIEKAVRTFTR